MNWIKRALLHRRQLRNLRLMQQAHLARRFRQIQTRMITAEQLFEPIDWEDLRKDWNIKEDQ